MEHYLGEKLKKLREDRKWSQDDLAKRLGKAASTISGYESDAHTIPLDVFISAASLFGISLDEFAGVEKTPQMPMMELSEQQQDILRNLRKEFLSPTGHGGKLSSEQMQILHDIIQNFSE